MITFCSDKYNVRDRLLKFVAVAERNQKHTYLR